MYALIRRSGSFVGIFSSKENMRLVIEALIKDSYETNGHHGNYNFRYIKFNVNEPWITTDGNAAPKETNAIFSLSTMHTEYFTHCIKTDWSTGEILDMDSDKCTNI